MAKTLGVTAVVLTVFCLCSLASATGTVSEIFVEGKVYCDPCRVQFQTRISEPLEGNIVSVYNG